MLKAYTQSLTIESQFFKLEGETQEGAQEAKY